jgi:flagellar protein FliS
MFGTAQRAINAYTNVGLETGVAAADPHKLVLMLYEGALLALVEARQHMARHEIAAKGQALSKAVMIIDNGLKASLDIEAGGELGERLAALYDYMSERLLQANLHNRPELIDEVSRLLTELRGAWEEIRPAAPQAARTERAPLPGKAG